MGLLSILGHASGQWKRSFVEIPMAKVDHQEAGKGISYFKKYTACAILGIAFIDDEDGEYQQQR